MKKKTEPLRGVCKECARAPKCREKNPVDDQGRKLRTIYCKRFTYHVRRDAKCADQENI